MGSKQRQTIERDDDNLLKCKWKKFKFLLSAAGDFNPQGTVMYLSYWMYSFCVNKHSLAQRHGKISYMIQMNAFAVRLVSTKTLTVVIKNST